MFMQAGFALLEAGTCRKINCGLVLMKNISDACVGAVVWWLVGYGLAYGVDEPNQFIGSSHFFGRGYTVESSHHRDWFFQWAFCATSATIVSGAVAERIKFTSYIIYAIMMTGLIYPVIVYWTWSGEGWLSKMGYSDFAGSGIVHLTGGSGALAAAAVLGPRYGRWKEANRAAFAPHDLALVVQGTVILWFGWYGFNCGSTLGFSNLDTAWKASLVAMNTTLAASFGGVTVLIVRFLQSRRLDLAGVCNGILAGLVAVCAGADTMWPYGAIVSGVLGGLVQLGVHGLVILLKIDDPLDAIAVHGGGGLCGVLLRPLLDRGGVKLDMLGIHVLGAICIMAWSSTLTLLVMLPLKSLGILITDQAEQLVGGDKEELLNEAYSQRDLLYQPSSSSEEEASEE